MELRVGHDHREEVGDAAGQLAFGDEDAAGPGSLRPVPRLPGTSRAVNTRTTPGIAAGVVGVNLQDLRARMLGEHHRAMQHAGHAHVVDERLLAERLLEPAGARDRLADAVTFAVAVAHSNAGIAMQAELFAEERVAPRLVRGSVPPFLHASPAVWIASMIRP